MADATPVKGTAPIVVPVLEKQADPKTSVGKDVSRKVSTIKPSLLSYLKEISSGVRRPSDKQMLEIREGGPIKDEHSEVDRVELNVLLDYMTRDSSHAMAPPKQNDLDLTHPLSSYFISSSHNTYLSGNQLYGDASAEVYKNVLLRGCRCVEIDVWDGEERKPEKEDEKASSGKEESEGLRSRISGAIHKYRSSSPSSSPSKNVKETKPTKSEDAMPAPWTTASTKLRAEPRVLHGHTLTREVPFRDVCEAVKEGAFAKSNLPVIVSLEVHAGPEQQQIMVDIMQKSWKGHLIQVGTDDLKMLPSPAELRNKILVKAKAASRKPIRAATDLTKSHSQDLDSESEDDKDNSAANQANQKAKKSKTIEALSEMAKYTRGYHFKSLTAPEATLPTHVFSLSESKFIGVHQSDGPTLFSHNKNYLMRAFPSGKRVSSSNLDPTVFWRKGVQMVALNWQRFDAGSMLNEAQFAGSEGWVLKPEGYRGSAIAGAAITNESQANAMPYKKLDFAVEVLAAQDLPSKRDSKFERLHPYVKCELHIEKPEERTGGPIEGGGKAKEGEHKRRSKNSKGVDPDFGGERLEFPQVSVVEELSFVRFKIQDDVIGKDDLLAWSCIRLDRLRGGYRLVQMHDAEGLESNTVLLVKIEKRLT